MKTFNVLYESSGKIYLACNALLDYEEAQKKAHDLLQAFYNETDKVYIVKAQELLERASAPIKVTRL